MMMKKKEKIFIAHMVGTFAAAKKKKRYSAEDKESMQTMQQLKICFHKQKRNK